MLKTIFLLLGGENEILRPRSKKTLHCVHRWHLKPNQYTILASGLSSFQPNVASSESSRMANYLLTRGIPKHNILVEEHSYDTLGNLIFSHIIIQRLLEQHYGNPIRLVLITEAFHLYRSKILFKAIFADLLQRCPNLHCEFMAADPYTLPVQYFKQTFRSVRKKIHSLMVGSVPSHSLHAMFSYEEQRLRDMFILDLILADIERFHIHTFTDFQQYLCSLPVYNQTHAAAASYPIRNSLYAKAIQHLVAKNDGA